MELDNRPETRNVEYETDKITKKQKWSSTATKAGVFLLPFLCVVIVLVFFLTCVTGGAGQESTEEGKMVRGQRMGDCVMVDFYKKGSLETNGVIVNPNRLMKDDACGSL